jgi:hypothetical protein
VGYSCPFSTIRFKLRACGAEFLTRGTYDLQRRVFKRKSKRQPSSAAKRIFGQIFSAAHLAKEPRVHNPGSDGKRARRDPAFRRPDDESSAENLGSALAVEFNREKKSHLNCGLGIQGAICTNEHTGNADVFRHSLMPFPLSSYPIPDNSANLVSPGSGNFCVSSA